MIDVSIIVPLYNSSRYIDSLYSSLSNLNYESYEVVFVDDGSKDNSVQILEKIICDRNKYKIYRQQNGGISSARNYGIQMSRGKYVMFMDHDDIIDKNIICENIRYFESDNVDIVKFGIERVEISEINKAKIYIDSLTNSRHFSRENICEEYYLLRQSKIFSYVWNGIYKRSIIEFVQFDEELKFGGEDSLFNFQYLMYTKNLYYNNHIYYQYNRVIGVSTSSVFNQNRVNSLFTNFKSEIKMMNEYGMKDEFFALVLYRYIINLVSINVKSKSSSLNIITDLQNIYDEAMLLGIISEKHKIKTSGFRQNLILKTFELKKFRVVSIMLRLYLRVNRI